MSMLSSSNPVLSDQSLGRVLNAPDLARSGTASVQGVMAKTGFCTLLAVGAGAVGYSLAQTYPAMFMISMIASLVVSLILFFVLMAKPSAAIVAAPVYSISQGLFLGCVSLLLEQILAARGISVAGGLALQAFVITGSLMAAMLALHTFGIIRAGPRFQSVLMVITAGLAIAMLAAWIIGLFGISMPWLSLSGTFGGGSAAWIGLGINAAILLLASLWLLVDLAQIDEAVAAGAPKSVEWMLAFGLIVTLAWVYLEALKLAFRLAAMFGDRKSRPFLWMDKKTPALSGIRERRRFLSADGLSRGRWRFHVFPRRVGAVVCFGGGASPPNKGTITQEPRDSQNFRSKTRQI